MPVPSRKKGRRSPKNCSKADRLSTDGSASTWPKSGLIAASSVRFEDNPYLTSAPMVPRWVRSNPLPRLTDELDYTEYGMNSRRRGLLMPVMPCTSPNCDARPVWDRRHTGQLDRSLVRPTSRCTATPKVCDSFFG